MMSNVDDFLYKHCVTDLEIKFNVVILIKIKFR